MTHRRLIAVFLLLVAACGGKASATGSAKPVAAVAPSTSTAAVAPPTAPLTGLPADPAAVARPVLAVKIDNVADAHPQVGINQADVVYEELVENSSTRLMALFQSTDAQPIGPVRSARPTDLLLYGPLHHPLFAWSGANAWVRDMVTSSNIVDVGNTPAVDQYYRESTRTAPHNLLIQGYFSMLESHQADAGSPSPLFTYRGASDPLPAGAHAVTGVHIEWGRLGGNAPVDYVWDAASGGWQRSQGGIPHVDLDGVQVAPPNVIIQFVDYQLNGGIPDGQLLGEGTAWVLTQGQLIEGRWIKMTAESPTQYVDATGAPIALTPGRTWVSLPPPDSASLL